MSFLFPALFMLAAALLPFVLAAWLAVGSRAPLVWVCCYFGFLFFFPNASWGLLTQEAGANFYTRGTGQLYFSLINLYLFGLAAMTFLARRLRTVQAARHNLGVAAALFSVVITGNVVVSFALPDVHWYDLTASSGLLNVVNFMLAFYVLTSTLGTRKNLERFLLFMVGCTLLRGLWGAVRYVALGGDPANFYANFQKIDVRLTFFDINDSLMATVTLFLLVWWLFTAEGASARLRFWVLLAAMLELFIVIFSYRRTAWIGFGLAAILLAMNLRPRLRNSLLASYVLLGLPLILYKMIQRGGPATHGGTLLEKLFPDVTTSGGGLSFTTGRFAELYAAFLSIKDSPFWGLGIWGHYSGFRFSELAWHNGDFGWMHSGVLHIMLKTGLIGLAISLAAMGAYARFTARESAKLAPAQRGWLLAGAAGALFILPDWLFGTPIIEYRTMQLLAIVVALPYVAAYSQQQADPA